MTYRMVISSNCFFWTDYVKVESC